MEFVTDIGTFALKTFFIVGALILMIAFLSQIASRAKSGVQLEIEKLNDRFRDYKEALESHLLSKKEFKKRLKSERKAEKKALKEKDKQAEKNPDDQENGRIFVLDFDGDLRASQVHALREEITAILAIATSCDEVVVRLESGGGLVTSYGLAASQLARIKSKKVKLTVCVDKVAASGGYMMACVADRILAAPFSVVGSIGVIAQVPNFNRVLKKHDIDYREVTAGQYKRTVTVFGEITDSGMDKFREQIEGTHSLFKTFVQRHRPALDLEKVATGEHWYAIEAQSLGLIDELKTSDEYLVERSEKAEVYKVRYHDHKKLIDRLMEAASVAGRGLLIRLLSDADRIRFGL